MAYRLGYKPGEWESLAPIELSALWDAWMWRRSREIEVIAVPTLWLLRAWGSKVDERKLLRTFPGYKEDKG